MTVKKRVQYLIRGWLPKEPNIVSLYAKPQPSKIAVIALILLFAAIPLFFLTLEASGPVRFGFLVFLIAASLIVGFVLRKEGQLKPSPRERQISIVVCSGLFTAFAVGTGLRVIIGPLPSYFWVVFIMLIAVGAFIGAEISKTLQKHDLYSDSNWR